MNGHPNLRNAVVLSGFSVLLFLLSGCDLAKKVVEEAARDAGGDLPKQSAAPKARAPNETVLARFAGIDAVAVDASSIYWRDRGGNVRSLPKKGGELKELGRVPKADGTMMAAASGLYLGELKGFSDSRVWRMPIEGGAANPVTADDNVHALALAPEGNEIFAACGSGFQRPERICVLRNGAPSYEMFGAAPPGLIVGMAVDRTHAWFQVVTQEKTNPASKDPNGNRTNYVQFARIARNGGVVEAGAKRRTEPCVLLADDAAFYCAEGTTLRRARKANPPIWESMATLPARAERMVQNTQSIFVWTTGKGVIHVPKTAVGAAVQGEVVAAAPTAINAFTADDDALYYAEGDELIRRSSK